MPISTYRGNTPWTSRQIADLCGVCPQRATAKMKAFESRAEFFLKAYLAARPQVRDCDLAEIYAAMVETGGPLSRGDRQQFIRYTQRLIRLGRGASTLAG